MKEVILEKPVEKYIPVEKCEFAGYYGVMSSTGTKNVLLENAKGEFETFNLRVNGDGFVDLALSNVVESLARALRYLLEKGYTVYQFDSREELLEWLLKSN